jgi:Electron transfer DM13
MADVELEPPSATTGDHRAGRRERGRRRWAVGAGALVIVAVAAVVLVWFQPQKLFIDERVDQPVPTATTAPPADDRVGDAAPGSEPSGGATGSPPETTAPPTTATPEPVDIATGSFVSLDHATSGTVRVLGLADGRRFVRLEGFATENGPDLYVYLSANPAGGPEAAFDDAFRNLGRLQGNIGDQNYEIPADLALDGFASVVVWCDRFDSAFGAADLAVS